MHLHQIVCRTWLLIGLLTTGISACKPSAENPAPPSPAPAIISPFPMATPGSGSGGLGRGSSAATANSTAQAPGAAPGQGQGQGTATSFAITCSNGGHLNGNYATNGQMCQALQTMTNVCSEALAFFQSNCATQMAGSQQPPSAVPGSTSTSTSFNVNCSNGSNYNGSYGNHQTMCSHLADKVSGCPEAQTLYTQLCP